MYASDYNRLLPLIQYNMKLTPSSYVQKPVKHKHVDRRIMKNNDLVTVSRRISCVEYRGFSKYIAWIFPKM